MIPVCCHGNSSFYYGRHQYPHWCCHQLLLLNTPSVEKFYLMTRDVNGSRTCLAVLKPIRHRRLIGAFLPMALMLSGPTRLVDGISTILPKPAMAHLQQQQQGHYTYGFIGTTPRRWKNHKQKNGDQDRVMALRYKYFPQAAPMLSTWIQ